VEGILQWQHQDANPADPVGQTRVQEKQRSEIEVLEAKKIVEVQGCKNDADILRRECPESIRPGGDAHKTREEQISIEQNQRFIDNETAERKKNNAIKQQQKIECFDIDARFVACHLTEEANHG
jgi:hypothetical protein